MSFNFGSRFSTMKICSGATLSIGNARSHFNVTLIKKSENDLMKVGILCMSPNEDNSPPEIFIQLGYLDDIDIWDAPSTIDQILRIRNEDPIIDHRLVALLLAENCETLKASRDGSIILLQEGDYNVMYDGPGGYCYIMGYDKNDTIFNIDIDGNRTIINYANKAS